MTGVLWGVLIMVGGQPLAQELLTNNVVRSFLVIAFVFLGVSQLLVMAFLWVVLFIVAGQWLKHLFIRTPEGAKS
jgi:hypothetical protein